MRVNPVKVQHVREGDLLMFNEGDDRRFTIGKVIHRRVHVPNDPKLTTYRITLSLPAGSATNAYYKNETVDRAVLS